MYVQPESWIIQKYSTAHSQDESTNCKSSSSAVLDACHVFVGGLCQETKTELDPGYITYPINQHLNNHSKWLLSRKLSTHCLGTLPFSGGAFSS